MLRRRLVTAVVALLLAAVASMATDREAAEIFGGLPHAHSVGERLALRILRNPGFTVGYSEWHRQPLWVAYEARPPRGRLGPRPERFASDPRVLRKVTSDDYTGSDYDRGHLAPNYLIGKLYGREAQQATFLMSNVSPQRPRLNGLVWQRIEEAEADVVVRDRGAVWVLAGPIFGERPGRLRSGIPVPEAFYRIWVDARDAAAPEALGFIVPQQVCGTEPLSRFIAAVDAIEQRTGLDFFRAVEDAIEAQFEAQANPSAWRLERFERRPPRYADKYGPLQC